MPLPEWYSKRLQGGRSSHDAAHLARFGWELLTAVSAKRSLPMRRQPNGQASIGTLELRPPHALNV
eukprot:5902577-Prymnesium_polylepis.2